MQKVYKKRDGYYIFYTNKCEGITNYKPLGLNPNITEGKSLKSSFF